MGTLREETKSTCRRVGAIDCGTNSIRLLVADNINGVLHDVVPRRTNINRLGFGVDRTCQFDDDALEKTFIFEKEYSDVLLECGVDKENLRFIATSAARDAVNRDVFLETTHSILGVIPEIIDGTEEAYLSFSGASSVLNPSEDICLVIDLGGGSTEIIVGDTEVLGAYSMNIGSVRITERYFEDVEAYPSNQQISTAVKDINLSIDNAFAALKEQNADINMANRVIAVAGTVTTLTAHALNLPKYMRERISGASISYSQNLKSADAILRSTKEQLSQMPFINPGRVDVIWAGALIWKVLLERIKLEFEVIGKNLDYTTTSEHDILDGIALSI
ncbi:MAG: Ppx/GppA family phosphatase [Candidatus Ancillula sp.]|nr:Ppx/GppA family phosphatase [Candidatus Ancillula sp.]